MKEKHSEINFCYLYKFSEKYIIFLKGFLLNRVKKSLFDLKSWEPLKIFFIRSDSYSRPSPISICQKTQLKSRWTVPLS
jgi:hypothetical protein